MANIAYTASPSGTTGFTDENGFFDFESGDTVTFSVRGVDLPSVPATGKVTINDFDKAFTADSEDLGLNIAILLQSLDSDGDASNGIQIPDETEETVNKAANVNFDQPVGDFVSDTGTGVQAALVEGDSAPVTADAAKAHLDSQMEDLLLSGTGTWRLYVIGDDPDIRNLVFTDDGKVKFENIQTAWYQSQATRPEEEGASLDFSASSDSFTLDGDELPLIYEGVGEENGEKWDVLVFAESASTLFYMDNRPTDLHDLGNYSVEPNTTWNLIVENDAQTAVEKGQVAFGENGQTDDTDTGYQNDVLVEDFFDDESLADPNDPMLGVLRTDSVNNVENYFLLVSGGDLTLLYHPEFADGGLSQRYTLMSENEAVVDSILNAMQ